MRVAYLGPAGTNTELAFREFLPEAEGLACHSVQHVFQSIINKQADAGFVPIENLIQGPVTETLDQLFQMHDRIFIEDGYVTPIRNAFAVLRAGKWPRPITAVYSHEQALRQCSRFLSEQCPEAEQVSTPSTAAGVQIVAEQKLSDAAVIAAPGSIDQEKFLIVREDVSDVAANKTRFVLLKSGSVVKDLPPKASFTARSASKNHALSFITSLVINPGRDRKGLLFEILNVISIQHLVNLVTIHSRPDTRGGVIFYLDLEGHPEDANIRECIAGLKRFCVDTTGETAQLFVLGAFPRNAFATLPFRTLGIVGSEGVMGKWFNAFFQDSGIEILGSDKNFGLSLSELAKKSDVILLSVPMSAASGVVKELLPLLRPGQLVVENCSVKNCILPQLSKDAPPQVEVLGVHTMFAGDRPNLSGENIIVTRTSSCGKLSQAFEDLLYKHGARICTLSIKEHDEIAAFVQSLLQLNLVILAEVMQASFETPAELEVMTTPNFRNVLNTMSRVLGQSDDLLVDLQTQNDLAGQMRQAYLDAATKLVSAINSGNKQALLEAAARGRKFLSQLQK